MSVADLRQYADVVRLWSARMDTAAIADRLKLPEHLVARWVANFREVMRPNSRVVNWPAVDREIQAGAYDA